jgi:amidase
MSAPLSRRAFVGASIAGGALAAGGALLPLAPAPLHALTPDGGDHPVLPPSPEASQVAPFELEEVTIAELQEGMQSGRLTARGVTERYLARIDELDRRGPMLRHIIETNPDALAIADALDAERKEKGPRGPLHGVPILIKDNIDTADRMTTTAGSLALEGSIAPRDAWVAERLRAAGAILLGKTNLSEWANFRSTHSSSGWSGRGGQARNPYALDRSTSGSSSGSAGAVAANLAAVAIGSETDGSIVSPSSCCGVVGIKPTVGLISRGGIIPISRSQDTAGPMARTVRDAAIVLGALVGVDPRDPATTPSRTRSHADYTRFLVDGGLKGARIGVARERFFGFSRDVDRLMEDALAAMKSAGASIVDPANLPHAGTYDDAEFDVLLYEFKAGLNEYLASLGPNAPIKSLADAIVFNEQHKDREMPYFGQEIFEMAQKKGPLTSPAYLKARAKCRLLSRTQGIDALMARHRLDAIVAPTNNPAWTIDLVNGDHFTGGSSTPAAVAGYPSITVPAGSVRGLPVGISFFGRAWSEGTLLRVAYGYEQATNNRAEPTMKVGID